MIFRKIFYFKLKILAKAVLKKYQPIIIAVTGSVGKTSTKEAIYCVVSSQFSARRNLGNFNNEIGVPLTIFGLPSYGKNIFGWLVNFARIFWMLLAKQQYPEVLILEFGADRPGDISYLTGIAKPHISVVTSIGEIPVHVEFYAGPKDVAKEKQKLVEVLESDDFAILNYDDDTVFGMKHNTIANNLTFGFGEGAIIRATGVRLASLREGGGVNFKVEYQSKAVSVNIPGILGKPQIYAALAAFGVGLGLNMKLNDIAIALHSFKALPGRLNLLSGIKHSWIIDDSYNAAPQSTHAALDILGSIKAKRKIAVLGDMLEIGKYTFEAHQTIGDRAAEVADILFVVGDKAKVIGEEAIAKGLDVRDVFWFDIGERDLVDAGKKLQEIIESGDLILIKGSQGMRLEKIAEEVMLEPQKARDLLVRQSKSWKATHAGVTE